MAIITQQAELPKSSAVSGLRQADTLESTSTAETPKEVTGTKAEEMLSPKYAALARQEQALRRRLQELKTKEDSWKAKEADYETSYIRKSKLQERLQQDPMAVMQEFGLSYDQLTQLALNQPDAHTQTIQKLENKIRELEEKQTKTSQSFEDQQKQAYEQAVNQIRNEAKILIDSDAAYETIKEMGQADAVVELIRETFDQQGVLMSVEEAAKEVETYLIEEALRLAQLNKVKQRLNPPAPAAEDAKLQPTPKLQPAMKTLTNAVVASSSSPSSARARRERAIAAFRGELTA